MTNNPGNSGAVTNSIEWATLSKASQWTNNACESMNHVLKQRHQWRRHMLPDLVENLRSVIASQYAEADRAICGRRNFILRPSHQKHRISVADWKALSEPQLQKIPCITENGKEVQFYTKLLWVWQFSHDCRSSVVLCNAPLWSFGVLCGI